MSEEKVIYEVGVQGVGSTISQINSIAGALAGVERAGQQAVASLSRIGEAVSAQLPQVPWFGNNNRVGFTDLGAIIKKATPLAGRLDPTGKQIFQNYKQQFVDLQSYLKKNFAFTGEENRLLNRYANFFGVGKIAEADRAKIRANIAQINPLWKVNEDWGDSHYFIPHMLFGEGWRIGDNPHATFDGSNTEKLKSRTSIRKKERQATHEYAERIRAENRKRWGSSNIWSSPASKFPIVPFDDGSLKREILNAARVQFAQNNAHIKNFGKLTAAFGKGGVGVFSTIGGKALTGFAALGHIGLIIWGSLKVFELVLKQIKKIGKAISKLSEEGWLNKLESNAFGMSSDELQTQRSAMMRLRGDPASASALMKRLSVDRAMIAYGGSGGSAMEAARLFGVNILGSGEYGFATNSEFMRNVAQKMETLSQSGKVALGNVLGLDKEQMWQVSRGVSEYDKITNAKTKRQQALGLESIYSEDYRLSSEKVKLAEGRLENAKKEFESVLGEWLNPYKALYSNVKASAIEWASKILSPSWAVYRPSTQAMTSDGRVVNLHIDNISLNSLGLSDDATPEQIREKLSEQILNPLGEELVDDRM